MDINQKLEHFKEISLQTASQHVSENLDKYKTSLDEIYENHKETGTTASKEIIETKKAIIKRNVKKDYSNQETDLKRSLTSKNLYYKKKIFEEVNTLLEDYKKSPQYADFLNKKITEAAAFAEKDTIEIYIDPQDSGLMKSLKTPSNGSIHMNEFSFGGGIRAIIPSRNILIDETFNSRVSEIEENYKINY